MKYIIDDHFTKISRAAILSVMFCAMLSISHGAFAVCAALNGKQQSDMETVECPSMANGIPCTPDAIDSKTNGAGAITACVLNGDDPPIVARPDQGTGAISGEGVTVHAQCAPSTDGSINCPVAITTSPNNTQGGFVPSRSGGTILPAGTGIVSGGIAVSGSISAGGTVNGGSSSNSTNIVGATVMPDGSIMVPPTASGLSQPAGCLTNNLPTPLDCGGAIPLANGFVTVAPNLSVGTAIKFNMGSNITIGAPSPLTPQGSFSVVNNIIAPVSCMPSTLQLPQDKVSLVVPKTSSLPVTAGTTSYKSDSTGVLHLPTNQAIKFDLSQVGIIQLPEGGNFTKINGQDAGDNITIPANDTIISYGNGTNILPMQGGQPPKNFTNPVKVTYQDEDGNTVTATVDSTYFQQTLNVPSALWPEIEAWDKAGLIPGAATYTYVTDNSTNPPTQKVSNITLTGLYVNTTDVSNDNFLVVYTSAVADYDATGKVININVNAPNGSVTPPSNSFLNLPSGTPVGFPLRSQATLNLSSGGSIDVPKGAIVTTGGKSSALTSGITVNIPTSTIITSNGSGQVSFGNGSSATTIAFPSGLTQASISTTMITITSGQGMALPVDGVVITPSVPAQNPQALPVCGSR